MSKRIKIKSNPKNLKAVISDSDSLKGFDSDREEGQESYFKQKLEQQYERGFKEGYDKGFKTARLELEEEFAQKYQKKTEQFYNVLSDFEEKLNKYENAFDDIIVSVSLKIAEKIIKRQIENRPDIEEAIRTTLKKVVGANDVTIKIHPEDYRQLEETGKTGSFGDDFTKIKFEQNDSIERGGFYIETEIGNVDARIKTQIAEIAKHLENYLESKNT